MNETYTFSFQPVLPQNPVPAPTGHPPVSTPVAVTVGANPSSLVYTVQEAAAALHVNPKTIRRLLDRGVLTASKALRKKLIPRSQIEGFLKATCDLPKTIH
jgi:excisionase family DNA binding protein